MGVNGDSGAAALECSTLPYSQALRPGQVQRQDATTTPSTIKTKDKNREIPRSKKPHLKTDTSNQRRRGRFLMGLGTQLTVVMQFGSLGAAVHLSRPARGDRRHQVPRRATIS